MGLRLQADGGVGRESGRGSDMIPAFNIEIAGVSSDRETLRIHM